MGPSKKTGLIWGEYEFLDSVSPPGLPSPIYLGSWFHRCHPMLLSSVDSGKVLKQNIMVVNTGFSKAVHLTGAREGQWGEGMLGQNTTGILPIGLLPPVGPTS